MSENTTPTVRRDESGKWLPGQSAWPSGRPAKNREIEELAHQASPQAFAKLLDLMQNHKDGRVQFQAASLVLAYAYGKPTERVQAEVTKLDIGQLYLQALQLTNEDAPRKTIDIAAVEARLEGVAPPPAAPVTAQLIPEAPHAGSPEPAQRAPKTARRKPMT